MAALAAQLVLLALQAPLSPIASPGAAAGAVGAQRLPLPDLAAPGRPRVAAQRLARLLQCVK
jgi:hypothetical protein